MLFQFVLTPSASIHHRLRDFAKLGCRFYSQSASHQASNQASSQTPSLELPKSSDVVVIGGGVIGLSTAYHLKQLGYNNVVVLERNRITSGTTWHSNGLVWRLRPSDTDIQLLTRTHQLVSSELVGHEKVDTTGFINNGGLFLAHNAERIREYERIHGMAKYYGIESKMMNRNQILDLVAPLIEPYSDLVGGLLSPNDGYIDPTMYCNALKKAGDIKVIENCVVTAIRTQEITPLGLGQQRKITGVKVDHEGKDFEMKTDIVVNSSGVWAPNIARLAGIENIPQETFEHGYLITQPIEDVKPNITPNIRDHDLSIAFRVSGQSFQISYYEENPFFISGKEESLSPFILFDFNWDRASQNIESSTKLMPIIGKVGVKSTICGPESFTPDHRPLLGEDGEVRGFYYASGFNSFGICLSGGCGQQLAHWIVKGRPELDMFNYDIRRFNQKLTGNKEWSKERCREAYARNYGIVYPMDEPVCVRDLSLTDPLHSTLLSHGCVTQERHGRLRPGWFDTDFLEQLKTFEEYLSFSNSFQLDLNSRYWQAIKHEYLACQNSVSIFDLSSMAKYVISGQEATQAIQWLTPFDVQNGLKDGQQTRTYMLNHDGGIEGIVNIYRISCDQYYVTTNDIADTYLYQHIIRELDRKEIKRVSVKNVTDQVGILALHGPDSRALIQDKIKAIKLNQILSHDNSHAQIEWQKDKPIRIVRTSSITSLGYELHIPYDQLLSIYKLFSPQPLQPSSITNAGWKTYETLMLESGLLNWGIEVRSDDRVSCGHEDETQEERAFNLLHSNVCQDKLKGNAFIGAQALSNNRKQHHQLKNKFFVLIKLKDKDKKKQVLPQGLEPIWLQEKIIGMTRSGCFSFKDECSLSIGYIDMDMNKQDINQKVRTSLFKEKQEIQIEINGQFHAANILETKQKHK